MNIIDFSNCKYSSKHGAYGGMSGRKDGVVYENDNWILKFPKSTAGIKNVPISYTTSPISEYVGSHIYEILGYDVHETELGIRDNKLVVACKDFEGESRFIEMRTIKNAANSNLALILDRDFASTGSNHYANIDELVLHLKNNEILSSIDGIELHFWNMAIVDIFIRNGDRNNGNWGILRTENCIDIIAPIFDNGGCFTDKADDEKLLKLLKEENIKNSSLNFRSSFGTEKEKNNPMSVKQLTAKDLLEYCMKYDEFRKAIIKNVPLIKAKMSDIESMINDIPNDYCYCDKKTNEPKILEVCSDIKKKYYIETMKIRLKYMLEPVYERVIEKEGGKSNNLSKNVDAACIMHKRRST